MAGEFGAGSVVSKMILDRSQWSKSVSGAKKEAKGLSGFITKNGESFKKVGKQATIAGIAIIGALTLMVKKASDAQEVTSRFGTVFESVFEQANQAAKDLAENYGLSAVAAKDMLGATGDLLSGLGVSSEAALSLSERTQQLAVDLASFTNFSGGAKGASEALTKAMLGERESVKSLGIVITEEMVKEQLLAEGKENLTGQALLQAKAEATLTIAISQSKNAIGDYARTSEDLANVTRSTGASISDLVVALGTHLIPIATKLTKIVKVVVEKITEWVDEHPKLTEWIMKGALAVGALMLVLGPLAIILPSLVTGFTMMLPILAAIGPVIAVIVTAFAAWKIGKKIGEITGFNKALQNLLVSEYAITAATDEAVAASKKLTKEYNLRGGEILKLKAKYGSLEAALEAVENGEVDLTGKTKKLKEEEEDLAGATKKLTKETDTLIKKLENVVPDTMELAKAFVAGKISILEYTTGMRNLRLEAERIADPYANLELALDSSAEGFEDWGESTEGVMGSVLESVGLWNQGSQAAYDENAAKAEEAAQATTAAWEEQNKHWLTLIGNMGSSFGNAVEGILSGSVSLKEGLAGIWTDIKGSFFSMVGDMAAEWATTFLKNTLLDLTTKTAKEAGESIVSNLGSAVSDAGKVAVNLAEGIAKAVVALAQGIVSAAKIIASGAGAILKAAAVLLAVYGAFKLINKLLGTAGGGAAEYTNKILLTIRDHVGAQSEKMDETNRLLVGFYGKYDAMLDQFYKIRAATEGMLKALTSQGTVYVDVFRSQVFESVGNEISDSIGQMGGEIGGAIDGMGGKIGGAIDDIDFPEFDAGKVANEFSKMMPVAQGGGVFTSPGPVMTHGTIANPEIIGTARQLSKMGVTEPKAVNVYQTVNINGKMITTREYTREEIIPEILDALDAKVKRSEFQDKLGIS